MSDIEIEFRNNDEGYRYEAWSGSELMGQIDYRLDGDVLTVTHTGTPTKYQGQGIAGRLTRFMLDDVRALGMVVKPLCPYTAQWIEKHPDYADLLA